MALDSFNKNMVLSTWLSTQSWNKVDINWQYDTFTVFVVMAHTLYLI